MKTKCVVAYYSRKLSYEESRYHSYEQETLALVSALKHFRVYLLGIKFDIITDCVAVRTTAVKKDILPHVARWWNYMQDFNFEIKYRPGKRISHVDYLSRNPVVNVGKLNLSTKNAQLRNAQGNDPKLSKCRKILETEQPSKENKNYFDNFELKSGLVYRKVTEDNKTSFRCVVPPAIKLQVMQMYHDRMSHLGWVKCLETMKNIFWFPKNDHSCS